MINSTDHGQTQHLFGSARFAMIVIWMRGLNGLEWLYAPPIDKKRESTKLEHSIHNRQNICVETWHFDRAMRKRVFRHIRIAKAQISLRIYAGWSGPSLSADRIIGYYRMYESRANVGFVRCACAGWAESAYFAHARRHFIRLTWPI